MTDTPTDEPLSLPDLYDLTRETAEALDTLVEHATALRRAVVDDPARVVELHAIGDYLDQAWAACRKAQQTVQDLAAVTP